MSQHEKEIKSMLKYCTNKRSATIKWS